MINYMILLAVLLITLQADYKYIGCYKDSWSRALRYGPQQYGYTIASCSTACPTYKYFALQHGSWCCCDNDLNHAKKYGAAPAGACPTNQLGGVWANDIFQNSKGCKGVFLSNLQVSSDLIGWNDGGPKGVNSWFGHTTMLMGNGHTYNNFLVIHPPPNDGFAYKRYTLNGDYSRFSAVVGVARTSNGCENKANYGSFRVDIVIDNVVKYTRTGYAQLGDGSYDNVGIDVSGANVLEIRTYRATDNYFCDHPAIANPLLSCGGNYVFVTDKKTFTQAKEYCINSYPGGHLAVISGRVENEKVTEKCRYIGQLQHACWIGLTNPAISRGKWMDGKPITYTNWYDGGDGGSSQPCTTMRADGLWHTVGYCENGGGDALPFICEYTVSGAYSKPGLFLENLSFDSSGISMYWMYTIAILLFINVVCFAIYWCKCG
eukprot:219371_1